MRAIVITAADEAYAALVTNLVDSLAPHLGPLQLDLGLLDLGLAPASRERLGRQATRVVVPPWPFKPHQRFGSIMKWRSRTARPFLRELFPGYDVYIWLDADTFVQSAQGLRWLLDAGSTASVAVVPAVDRSYYHHPRQVEWLLERYRMAFDAVTAKQLMQRPYINAGVFAFSTGSPVWEAWARRFQTALERWDGEYLSDQAVLNGTLVLDRIPLQRLPASCNWICHLALPRWYGPKRLFVEPSYPFATLFIVHNTLVDKAAPAKLLDEAARPCEMRISWPGLAPGAAPAR